MKLKPSYLITAAAGFMAAVALTHATVLIWAPALVIVAYILGRLNAQKPARKPARKPPTEFAERKRAAQRQPSTPRGWLPPANPDLIPMMVSKACDEGDCVACPPGCACECACMHNSFLIEARNNVLYDAEHAKAES